MRRELGWGGLLLVAALGLGCGPESPRNLLLVSIDTLSPDRTSTYGHSRRTTPVLDAIAARGVRFSEAYSVSPWTLPAHAALLSGRYPSSLAPDPNDPGLYRVAPSLAERFRRAGYRTGALTGGGFVGERFGADAGFEFLVRGPPRRLVLWMKAWRDEPFFLFFHTYRVHMPYEDRRYAADLDPGRLARLYTDDPDSHVLHFEVCCKDFGLTPAEREYMLALYDGGVASADELLGVLWRALEALELLDRTAVVVTSDHGEEFWQHTARGAYHGHTLYDELLRVPLVWYEPGLPEPGLSVAEPVSLIDVVPTVIARFDLDTDAEPVDGTDLSPLLEGRSWTVERALFAEGVRHGPARTSVRTRRGKLIETPGTEQRGEGAWAPVPVGAPRELYLPDDPAERHNRAAENPDLVDELAALIAAQRARAAAVPPPPADAPLDAKTREELRALGYLQAPPDQRSEKR